MAASLLLWPHRSWSRSQGLPLREHSKTFLFEPLGMTNSGWHLTDHDPIVSRCPMPTPQAKPRPSATTDFQTIPAANFEVPSWIWASTQQAT